MSNEQKTMCYDDTRFCPECGWDEMTWWYKETLDPYPAEYIDFLECRNCGETFKLVECEDTPEEDSTWEEILKIRAWLENNPDHEGRFRAVQRLDELDKQLQEKLND